MPKEQNYCSEGCKNCMFVAPSLLVGNSCVFIFRKGMGGECQLRYFLQIISLRYMGRKLNGPHPCATGAYHVTFAFVKSHLQHHF